MPAFHVIVVSRCLILTPGRFTSPGPLNDDLFCSVSYVYLL